MQHYAGSLCPDDDGLGTQLSLIDDDDANAQGAVHISTEGGPRDSVCGLRVLRKGWPCPNAVAFPAEPFLVDTDRVCSLCACAHSSWTRSGALIPSSET